MTTAVANFIEALLAHYPVRHDSEEREDAWVKSLTGALRSYGSNILTEVAQEIIRTRKYRNFPLLSEILDKCDDIEKRRERTRREAMLPPLIHPSAGDEWSTERVKLAYDLIKSGVGKQAARDNPCWIKCLWDFCRKNQRLPDSREVDQLKREAHEFDEAYQLCVAGEAGPLSKVLERLGDSMAAKREKLCAEVLGQ